MLIFTTAHPRDVLGPTGEHRLLCASEQKEVENFQGRVALVWTGCRLALSTLQVGKAPVLLLTAYSVFSHRWAAAVLG